MTVARYKSPIILGATRGCGDGARRNGALATSSTASQPFTGPRDAAKANEYRDLDSTAIGVVDIVGGGSSYYFRGFGENFGHGDEYFKLRGGSFGVFKAQLSQDKMPHNLSWNALTPLSNPGGTLQVGPGDAYPPALNPALWNSLDYALQRKTSGGNFEFSANSPWFVRADYNEVTTTGVRPGSAQLGTGSGNGIIEFGVPTRYKTKNSTLEGGYAGATWNVKLGFLASKFQNSINAMQWTNFYMRSMLDTSLLPPENDLKKWSLNASVRQLPLDSTFAARVTYAKLTSGFDVTGGGLKPTGNQAPPTGAGTLITLPSPTTFSGEHETTSASLSLASAPPQGAGQSPLLPLLRQEQQFDADRVCGRGIGRRRGDLPREQRPERRQAHRRRPERFLRRSRQVPHRRARQLGRGRVQPGLSHRFLREQPAAG